LSAPVLSWPFIAQWVVQPAGSTRRPPPQEQTTRAAALLRPAGLALRANPFPEVTDLFCRLPLSTLFYRLEATHLGDLMRLSVRPGVQVGLERGFSRTLRRAPDAQ